MTHVMPYLIPELKARIDNCYGVSLDNVYACDVPVTVEYEYDRDEDEPPQVRRMVVKCAEDWTLGSDDFQLIIKQGANLNNAITAADENAIEDAIHKRMEKIRVDENEAMHLHRAGL